MAAAAAEAGGAAAGCGSADARADAHRADGLRADVGDAPLHLLLRRLLREALTILSNQIATKN